MFREKRSAFYDWFIQNQVLTKSKQSQALQQLLLQVGNPISFQAYVIFKKSAFFLCGSTIALALIFGDWIELNLLLQPVYLYIFSSLLLITLFADNIILEGLSKRRRARMTEDIFVLSRQLLYFSDSTMHLHTKLQHCLPFAHMIRNELYSLINEWYEGPDQAIERFKKRIGTSEGYSFAETLHALHKHEDASYYDLLRERIHHYKEKIELDKENKKESVSYLLFLLAGIPILYTFRVFIYPWVAEGQKIFNSLN
jgi:hypothetical protein